MLGEFLRAVMKSYLSNFSLSPMYLLIMSELLNGKKLALHIVAHAYAINVLPVPGGPYRRIPFHGFRIPLKMDGNLVGKIIDSFKAYFAESNPATSSHLTFGFCFIIISEIFYSSKFYAVIGYLTPTIDSFIFFASILSSLSLTTMLSRNYLSCSVFKILRRISTPSRNMLYPFFYSSNVYALLYYSLPSFTNYIILLMVSLLFIIID